MGRCCTCATPFALRDGSMSPAGGPPGSQLRPFEALTLKLALDVGAPRDAMDWMQVYHQRCMQAWPDPEGQVTWTASSSHMLVYRHGQIRPKRLRVPLT